MACCCHIPVWIVWITAAGNFNNNQHRTSVIFLANGGEENEWGDNSDLVTYITIDTQSGFRAVGPITQFSPLPCSRFPHFVFQLPIKSFQTRPSICCWLFLCFYFASRSLKVIFWFSGTFAVSLKILESIFLDENIRSHNYITLHQLGTNDYPSRDEFGAGGAPGVYALWVRWWGGTHLGWGQGLWGGTIWFFKLFSHFIFIAILWMNLLWDLGSGRWDFSVSHSVFSSAY